MAAFPTDQLYSIVNEAASQALGETAIAAIDTSSLVTLGNQILSSNSNTESYLNVLPQRVGEVFFASRPYVAKSHDMWMSDMEYGMIAEKINVELIEAEEDPSYNLQNGKSVDMFTVHKPEVSVKLFVKRTPDMFSITITRQQLKESFLGEAQLSRFIAYIMQQVQNSITFAFDNLAKLCLANFMAETTHEIKLVTEYNALAGTTLTAGTAMYDDKFMRYALARIKEVSKGLTDMSKSYNDGAVTRHTPYNLQRIKIWSKFQTLLETQVQYAAYHDNYVKLNQFTEYNFWQSEQTPSSIMVNRESDGTEVRIDNIVAVIHDRAALGLFKREDEVLTTPINAKARYYNVFYHHLKMWFNDTSENFVMFTLN